MADAPKFQEQIAFLLGKTDVPTRSWIDVWHAQHDVGFMVAGAYKAELLADLRAAVQSAVIDTRSLKSFQDDFDTAVQKHGWSYNGSRGWRTRVIYETNMRTSYQAGRYAQLTDPDFLKANPYWRYKHSPLSVHPRADHLAWDGLVLAADDDWWKTHYPPNGWGCKCTVFAENDASLARKKLAPQEAPPIDYETRVVGQQSGNPQTVQVPKGIDPGWGYAPGATQAPQVRAAVENTIGKLPAPLAARLQFDIDHIPPAPPAPVQLALPLIGGLDLRPAPPKPEPVFSEAESGRILTGITGSPAESLQAKSHPDFAGMTANHRRAITGYTDHLYARVNRGLRNEKPTAEVTAYRDLLNQALDLADPKAVFKGEVERGINLAPERVKALVARYRSALDSGRLITEPAFLSTSTHEPFSGNVLFTIQSRTGVRIKPLSDIPQENEVLFKAGSRFRVLKVQRERSNWRIVLEEVP